MSDHHLCGLCGEATVFYHADSTRVYVECLPCGLVGVPVKYHLDERKERDVYDQHQNSVDDPGYRVFLKRLAEPLMDRLPAPVRGLDFGCGPGPALAAMLTEAGHCVRLYDKFYFPDASVLSNSYDFITATEVVEHLPKPGDTLGRLWALLVPGGWLAIMTKRVVDREAFAGWHYKNDPTHISFFHQRTFEFLATDWNAELLFPGADTVLLRKKPALTLE